MEVNQPQLRMGLFGFPDEDYPLSLLRTRALVPWERSAPEDADALWVHGESAGSVREGMVKVRDLPGRPGATLDLQALRRPTFFTEPISDPGVRAPLSFNPRSAPSVERAFRRAEAVLHPLVLQLAIARAIAQRIPELTAHTYHLTHEAKLVAVVNIGGSVGFDLRSTPAQLHRAEWRSLPRGANALPPHFFATSFAEILWAYLPRTTADLLPRRYRESLLYFRAIPRVSQRNMKDAHYSILSELGAEPQNFRQLQQNVGLGEAPLANALAMLYYAGAITTNPVRAAKGSRLVREADSPSELRESMFPKEESQMLSAFEQRSRENSATVPAPLKDP